MLDLHSHVVPGVDDGASSFDEAKRLLFRLKQQGVTAVVATPHFSFRRSDPDAVNQRILTNFEQLKSMADEADLPRLFLGYEVSYHRGISHNDEIVKYTIGGTNKLLLELPMAPITDEIVNEVAELGCNYRLVVILAHLERYAKCPGFEKIITLLREDGVLAQVSTSSALTHRERKAVEKLAKGNCLTYLGSDAHSLDHRPPCFREFLSFAQKKIGSSFCRNLLHNGEELYGELIAAER